MHTAHDLRVIKIITISVAHQPTPTEEKNNRKTKYASIAMECFQQHLVVHDLGDTDNDDGRRRRENFKSANA